MKKDGKSEALENLEQLMKISRAWGTFPAITIIEVVVDDEIDIEKEIREQLDLLKERSKDCSNQEISTLTRSMLDLWEALAILKGLSKSEE